MARKKGRADDLRPEYRFDYRKAKSNRFTAVMKEPAIAVVLDPDVAAIFRTPESVNRVLRSVISALPERVREEVASYGVQPTAKRSSHTSIKSRATP